jgi:hypothetical protein
MLDKQQSVEYRMVVIEPGSARIVTVVSASGAALLRESIPPYMRIAAALTEALEQHHGLHTIQLAILPKAPRRSHCAVHELLEPTAAMSHSLSLTPLDDLSPHDLTEEERTLIHRIILGQATELGRFASLGWINEVFAVLGYRPERDTFPAVHHINQSINFCLLSFKDNSGIVRWFKAVGEPNEPEYALTAELARRFPGLLPRILATFPEWNGWVMENIEGVPLNRSANLNHCRQALAALARMQIEIASDVQSLSALGAKDWRSIHISSLSEPFFAEARRAMEAQTSTISKPLSSDELRALQSDVQFALREFGDSGIPETLVHGDIGHGNVIASADGPVFLDWAETCIGHPFICAEYLFADFTRSNQSFASNETALRHFYADHWRQCLAPTTLQRIVVLAPAMAAFEYALFAWNANRERRDPTLVWPLLRSMLRRTKRELEHAAEVTV